MTENFYTPIQNGIQNADLNYVSYIEYEPLRQLPSIAVNFWELNTTEPLKNNFTYTVMPDACIDLIFSLAVDDTLPFLMTPHVSIEKLNLGVSFHYIGVRFKPGAFTKVALDAHDIVGQQIEIETMGNIDLLPIKSSLQKANDNDARLLILEKLINLMYVSGYVTLDPLIDKVVTDLQIRKQIKQVAMDAGYSARQLQRIVKERTGYTPVQLHRILRFQAALSDDDTRLRFADESHLIKEFRRITGSPYRQFVRQFS